MLFALKIILSAFLVIVGVGLILRKSFVDGKAFEESRDDAIDARSQMNETWDQFYQYFLNSGFEQEKIEVIKSSIQQVSDVGKILILPKDSLYSDLKIDSVAGDDDEMMFTLFKKLEMGQYKEGELLDNDVNTVEDLFKFVKEKQRIETANKNTLFLK